MLEHEAVAAVEVDGVVGGLLGGLGREGEGHGRQLPAALVTCVQGPGGLPREKTGAVERGGVVGQWVGHALVAPDHRAEGPAFGGVGADDLVGGGGQSHQGGRGEYEPLVESGLEQRVAAPPRASSTPPSTSMSASGAEPRLATVRRAAASGDTSSRRAPTGTISASQMAPAGTSVATPARGGCRAMVTSRSPASRGGDRLGGRAGSFRHGREQTGGHLGLDDRRRCEGAPDSPQPRERGRAGRRPNPRPPRVRPCSARRSGAGCATARGRSRRVRPLAPGRSTTPGPGGWRRR